jgi:1-acyl-sn-glycerol-3-phosphate acyltransferase
LQSGDYGLDVDHVSAPEPLLPALRRRFGGRYPIDPFGLDPHLADQSSRVFTAAVRVSITGEEHLPRTGAAVLVANRGFGIVEPAALAVAVRRAVGRRLRVVGAPSVPVLDAVARRLGAIAASPRDVAAALRAGHLVAVPLAPTWLRRGVGMPPLPLMVAITRAPVLPVSVAPGGPLGTWVRPWRVRFGAPVVLDEPLEPGDPLGAARLAEAVRDAVAAQLAL